LEQSIFSSSDSLVIYQVISLIIFFSFFIVLVFWIFKMDKKFIKEMSESPIEKIDNNIFKKESTCQQEGKIL